MLFDIHILRQKCTQLTSLTRCATFVALPVRHDAPLSWLYTSHCELCKCKWESFMTNQNICCDSALASSVLADAESYFWIDFSQGESVAESGSIISHYFRTYFSLYVVLRGLNNRVHRNNSNNINNNSYHIERRNSRFFYNLLTAPWTVSNRYALMARVQLRANHMQHIQRLSRATCRVPTVRNRQLSC